MEKIFKNLTEDGCHRIINDIKKFNKNKLEENIKDRARENEAKAKYYMPKFFPKARKINIKMTERYNPITKQWDKIE